MANTEHRQKLLADRGAELTPEIFPLSPRQAEATWYAFEGLTAEQTAGAMRCQVRTVVCHLQSSMDKLGALNKTHLVGLAIRKGIISVRVGGFATVRMLATLAVGTALYFSVLAPDSHLMRSRPPRTPRPVTRLVRRTGGGDQ